MFNQVTLWVGLVVFVGLLTLLFSLLGTISCSVIVGVMMGASRRWRWQAIPISIVFPAVIVALSRISRTELDWQHTMKMAVLCFAVFWTTHLVTFLLMFLERPSESSAPRKSPQGTASAESSHPVSEARCSLGDIRGEWVSPAIGGEGRKQRKVMTILENEFCLSQESPDGKRRVIARGKVEWVGTRQPRTLVIYGSDDKASSGETSRES